MSNVKDSGLPIWKKALRQPEKVKQVLRMVQEEGLWSTQSRVRKKLQTGKPMGYSASGIVVEKGKGITGFSIGDRVACAGAEIANHAEMILVPQNLTVPIPKSLEFPSAATVTLGSIALQGVRRAHPTMGETFVVIGLGLLGQLTVQMLKANGCRVIGTDLDRDRLNLAGKMGVDFAIATDGQNVVEQISRLTDGTGADGVLITAATPSSEVVSTAFQMCRRKGRVVLVGDVGLDLKRADFYSKELDFFISTSYGPGRYDPLYEEKGMDYPISYVRWTENRNMREYLRLLVDQKVKVEPLIHSVFQVEKAAQAYHVLSSGKPRPMIVLLSYPQTKGKGVTRAVPNPMAHAYSEKKIRLAVVGAGGFAKGMHLPNLQALSHHYHLRAIISRTGANANATARQFGADYASTDFAEVLKDRDTDAVLIATRHQTHASMTLEALKAGKHVLVEKPLALNEKELSSIEKFYEKPGGKPVLLTGFNRRFSKYARVLHEAVQKRTNPMILNYRMNAGHIPLDHWVHGEEGGGRNIGEACHIYDLFTYLTGARVVKVEALALKPATAYYSGSDNFVATLSFEDGSLATLTYTALGSKDHPKEMLEVYLDGKVIALNDYKELAASGVSVPRLLGKTSDKGQKEELEAFARTIQKGGEWPIALWEQLQASRIALRVEELLMV